jgi:hypothetical protein
MATYTTGSGSGTRRWLPVGATLAAALLVGLIAFHAGGRSGDDTSLTASDAAASPTGTAAPDDPAGGSGGSDGASGDGDTGSGGSGGSDSSSSGADRGGDSGGTGGDDAGDGAPLEILELGYSARVLDFNPSDPGDPDFNPVPEVWISGRVIDPDSPLRGKRLKTAYLHFGDGTSVEAHFNTNHAGFRIDDTGDGYRYDPSYLGRTVTLTVVMHGHAGQVETREVSVTLPTEADETVHGSFE